MEDNVAPFIDFQHLFRYFSAAMKTLLVWGTLFLSTVTLAQVNSLLERQKPVPQRADVRKVFDRVEAGVFTGSVHSFSGFFSPQVRVSISGKDDGYFSANQTAAVLQNYFAALKVSSFSFSRFQEKGDNPYATGRLAFVSKGNQESVQVYVALAFHESKWLISQFNVY